MMPFDNVSELFALSWAFLADLGLQGFFVAIMVLIVVGAVWNGVKGGGNGD